MSQNFTIRVNPTVGAPNGDGTNVPGNNSYEQVHRPREGYNYDGFNTIYNIAGGFGGAPAYPNAWMRIQRQGQTIRAWKSSDGVNWEGPANVTYTDDPETPENELWADKLYVGVFYAPEFANNDILAQDKLTRSGIAKFREYGPMTSSVTPTIEIARDGANVKITYTGSLESADTINASSWSPVSTPSPASIPASSAQKYFRSRQ
jgi:hypothetical protein